MKQELNVIDSPNDSVSCASLLKVLADETRLAVVRQLMQAPHLVGELNDAIDVEQSLLSHHLRVLRDANIVTAERVGKAVRYALAPHVAAARSKKGLDLGCCKLVFE